MLSKLTYDNSLFKVRDALPREDRKSSSPSMPSMSQLDVVLQSLIPNAGKIVERTHNETVLFAG